MAIQKIFIVGAGFMGTGIAENAATNGIEVVTYDIIEPVLERSKRNIDKNLTRKVTKGRMTEADKEEIIGRITWSSKIGDCADADIIIEAVSENKELKGKIIKEIEEIAPDNAIIASNTSSISISYLSGLLKDPSRMIGMHFFSPVPAIPLMEIVRGLQTGVRAKKLAIELAETMGKKYIQSRDEPGFLINRMLLPMLNEACVLVERHVGTIEEIDHGMKLGLNHPMGPLELMDMIGIDIELSVMNVLHEEIGDSKYRPAQLIRRMVDAGYLGRKTGIGFYIYDEDGRKIQPNTFILK